jgi:hypothetical protein
LYQSWGWNIEQPAALLSDSSIEGENATALDHPKWTAS